MSSNSEFVKFVILFLEHFGDIMREDCRHKVLCIVQEIRPSILRENFLFATAELFLAFDGFFSFELVIKVIAFLFIQINVHNVDPAVDNCAITGDVVIVC